MEFVSVAATGNAHFTSSAGKIRTALSSQNDQDQRLCFFYEFLPGNPVLTGTNCEYAQKRLETDPRQPPKRSKKQQEAIRHLWLPKMEHDVEKKIPIDLTANHNQT